MAGFLLLAIRTLHRTERLHDCIDIALFQPLFQSQIKTTALICTSISTRRWPVFLSKAGAGGFLELRKNRIY
ncbi:hypothetical protein A936_01177 [Enterobacter sp. Ag1]|nr:hypothetical protein A936_01177 [Enterobacter sp. Ag1]